MYSVPTPLSVSFAYDEIRFIRLLHDSTFAVINVLFTYSVLFQMQAAETVFFAKSSRRDTSRQSLIDLVITSNVSVPSKVTVGENVV